MALVWVGVFLAFLFLEAITVSLVSIWFCAGSVVAGFLSYLHAPLWMQFLAFALVSACCLLIFYPISRKIRSEKTNADSLVGSEAIVTERIDSLAYTGRVRVRGQDWAALSENGETIEKDRPVKIVSLKGVRLIVAEKEGGM